MKAIHQTNTKQILKEARIFLPLLITAFLTITSAYVLSSHTSTALDQNSVSASVKVSESCAMTISGADSHSVELVGGMVEQNIGESTISVACNDINGYSIYAVGYGNGTEGNTNLTGTNTGEIIPTGTDIPETSGNPVSQSQWAMRLSAVSSEFVPTIVSDSEGSFASNHKIPSHNTKVATFTNNISLTGFSKISTTYAVGVIPYQAADTYTGQVKYTLVHPNFADSNQKVYMQDLTPSMIADLLPNVGNTFTAYDKRDNQSYKIAKLADGKYWMVENLNLAGGTTVTPDDSNVTENYTLPASATKNANDNNLTDATQFSNNATAYVFNSGNKTDCGASGQNIPCGSYYSYLAATAGTGASVTGNGYNTSGSICPKGWRLPTATTEGVGRGSGGYTGGDFYNLAIQYGMATGNYYEDPDNSPTFASLAGPDTTPGFLLAGNYNGSTFYYGGSRGRYWSSTSNSGTNAYNLTFGSSNVTSADGISRGVGFSVRCLFETRDITDISTMQEISPAIAANTAENTSATLTDARDNNTYTVKKINGDVWMTQNLRFTGTSVPSATSNVTADKTLTYYSLNSSNAGSFGAYSDHCDSTNGYNYACIYGSGSTDTGVWYNYYAATAGTISTDSNDATASQDICPKNWHLPTAPSTTSGTDINKLVGNTTPGWHNPTTGLTAFNAVAGGLYVYGSLNDTGYGRWWSATADSTTLRYYLIYNSSDGQFFGNGGDVRHYGYFVRCLANS